MAERPWVEAQPEGSRAGCLGEAPQEAHPEAARPAEAQPVVRRAEGMCSRIRRRRP